MSSIVLPAQRDLQRLAVEARALARAARDLDVRHEVELRRDDALALALFAAPALDVEAESARLVVALDRERRRGEEIPNRVVEPDVRRRIRPAVATDRRLVDAHDLVHVLDAVDAVVIAGQRARVDESLPERLVQNVRDERALARAGRARDRDHLPERNRHGQRLEIVLAGAANDQRLAVALPALRRHRDRARAREELTRWRRFALEQVVDRPLRHHASAVHAGARPHLDDVIGGANRVLVVLDDDHGVADVAKPLDRRDHLDVVFRMQPDARLVQHVEHAHQARADLRRQTDPLRLAARQRARSPVEAEIVQADAEQQIQPAANVIQHLSSCVGAAAGRLHGGQESAAARRSAAGPARRGCGR